MFGHASEKDISAFSDNSPATARVFANGFSLRHLWDIHLWPGTSRITTSFHQVGDSGVDGMSA